jgi:CubicO group peptidase (beta-lactamase class C family)
MLKSISIILLACFLFGCSQDEDTPVILPDEQFKYFPPLESEEWETVSISKFGWNEDNLSDLYEYLEQNNTRAFIVLKEGKIAIEKYWGNNITNTTIFNKNSLWYWASAGKTLTATLAGIAQEEGFLNINDKTSEYLGLGWTSLEPEKEDQITIFHQLTMTTGLDYNTGNLDCTLPACLTYKADAGNQWYYHNAPYTLIQNVISSATNQDYNAFTNQKLEDKTGMNGEWRPNNEFNNTYWSTARDMARFGLLIARGGKWEDTPVISDQDYLQQMITTSQNLNPSYGYLWWLNGKNSIILPGLPNAFNVSLSENLEV